MRLADWRHSYSVRLAVYQTLLFLLLAAVMFAGLYWGMAAYAREQLHHEIERELAALSAEDAGDEAGEIERDVRHRSAPRTRLGWYALQAADGRLIAGNFKLSALRAGWHELPYPATAEAIAEQGEHGLLALAQPLADGRWLAVGRDTFALTELGELYASYFGWISVLTLLLAVAGGAVTSRHLRRRTEALRSVTEAVGTGEFKRRVALTAGNDEFDRIGGHVNEMLDRIEHLMGRLRQVSLDIAHDLRTPLSRLRQKLESAHDEAAEGSSQRDAMAGCVADVDGILRTFAALLRIARIEDGSPRRGFERVDLSAVFRSVTEALAPVAEDAGHALHSEIRPGIAVEGDRDLLTQMLVNLLENAICHTPAGTRIAVSLILDAGGITGIVRDSGPGIPASERERIFHPFVRLDISRSESGNGLGLALVKAITDLHNATIAVEDGRPGALVRIRFASLPGIN